MKTEDIFIKQVLVGPMMNYAYLVGNRVQKIAAVVDPGWEGGRLIDEAASAGFRLTHILLTHTHLDHVYEVPYVAEKSGAPIYVHKDGARAFGGLPNITEIDEGDTISVGGLKFGVLYTPGHSADSVCYSVPGALFTGDTLFVDGIGRVDLPGGDTEAMHRSLARLRSLPDKTIVYPGHNYGAQPAATIGEQKRTNPYLQNMPLAEFLRIA